MKKILNVNYMILWKFLNIKNFLLKIFKVFVIGKIKNAVPWTYVINDLNGEEIVGTFYEKELEKTD